ncbi:MAG: hypothetical protein ABR567_13070 [Myxococcales bacterium]|nr:hypothetical protein [Myxococcales bacterium]
MATALIGHGGFVGGNLLAQAPFDVKAELPVPGEYDLVVCTADLRGPIERLAQMRAKRFLLVSTIDVYANRSGVDEDGPIDPRRGELETFCAGQFQGTIVRLPIVFGTGLRENLVYDLLNDHDVENVHPDGIFQYYAVARLWHDASIALERALPIVNFVSEPVPTRELALRCFGRELTSYPSAPPAASDVRSKHAASWGGTRYLHSKERVLAELTEFVEQERAL